MSNTNKPIDTAKPKKVLWSLPDFKISAEELTEIREAFDYTNEVRGHNIFVLNKFIPILSKVSTVLQNEGFDVADVTAENYKIILESSRFEYHVYRSDKKDVVKSFFDIHCDSEEEKLHTLIYYPVMTFPYGGRLFVRNTGVYQSNNENKKNDKDNQNSKTEYAKQFYDEPDTASTLSDIENDKDNFIPFKAENCICLNGTTDHYVEEMRGDDLRGDDLRGDDLRGGGIRESIVFSIVTKQEHQLDLADRTW